MNGHDLGFWSKQYLTHTLCRMNDEKEGEGLPNVSSESKGFETKQPAISLPFCSRLLVKEAPTEQSLWQVQFIWSMIPNLRVRLLASNYFQFGQDTRSSVQIDWTNTECEGNSAFLFKQCQGSRWTSNVSNKSEWNQEWLWEAASHQMSSIKPSPHPPKPTQKKKLSASCHCSSALNWRLQRDFLWQGGKSKRKFHLWD